MVAAASTAGTASWPSSCAGAPPAKPASLSPAREQRARRDVERPHLEEAAPAIDAHEAGYRLSEGLPCLARTSMHCQSPPRHGGPRQLTDQLRRLQAEGRKLLDPRAERRRQERRRAPVPGRGLGVQRAEDLHCTSGARRRGHRLHESRAGRGENTPAVSVQMQGSWAGRCAAWTPCLAARWLGASPRRAPSPHPQASSNTHVTHRVSAGIPGPAGDPPRPAPANSACPPCTRAFTVHAVTRVQGTCSHALWGPLAAAAAQQARRPALPASSLAGARRSAI